MTDGVSGTSMERVAREANVFKGLMYAYFEDQVALLQSLLVREHKRLQRRQIEDAEAAASFIMRQRRGIADFLARHVVRNFDIPAALETRYGKA